MTRFLAFALDTRSEARVEDQKPNQECLTEREIDDLIFGRLPSGVRPRCLAHLIWCGNCQERVEEEREFAQATRKAAMLLERETPVACGAGFEAGWWVQRLAAWVGGSPSSRWTALAASACMLLALGVFWTGHRSVDSRRDVWLRSERGIVAPAPAESPASGHLRLRIDTTDVAPFGSYTVAVVDAAGRELETKAVAVSGGSLSFGVEHALAPGRYWIRLSAPDGRLLREYALQVR